MARWARARLYARPGRCKRSQEGRVGGRALASTVRAFLDQKTRGKSRHFFSGLPRLCFFARPEGVPSCWQRVRGWVPPQRILSTRGVGFPPPAASGGGSRGGGHTVPSCAGWLSRHDCRIGPVRGYRLAWPPRVPHSVYQGTGRGPSGLLGVLEDPKGH